MIKVEYTDHMGNDSSISNAARVSFCKWKEHFDNDDERLIGYLARHKHMTPFRHNQIQIRCKVPIFIARQLGKHQAGLSWNEVSRRYVKTAPEFYFPDNWRAAPEGSIKQGSAGVHENNDKIRMAYDELISMSTKLYDQLVEDKVAPEMVRMVLPQSMMTEWIWTGNLLAFAHVYKERIAGGAQEEVRVFAEELDKVIRPLFPISWAALVD